MYIIHVSLNYIAANINIKDKVGKKQKENVKGIRRRLDERTGTGEIDFSRLVHRPIARVSKVTY